MSTLCMPFVVGEKCSVWNPSIGSKIRVDGLGAHLLEQNDYEFLSVEEPLDELLPVEDFISIIQKCRNKGSLTHAKHVHTQLSMVGLEGQRVLGNYLVQAYVECGSMSSAEQVSNRLVLRNDYSWTSLIVGYAEYGDLDLAFHIFKRMQDDSVHPNTHTFVSLLKACSRLTCLERGRKLHAEIGKERYKRDLIVASALVDMYAKCGSLAEARKLFDELPVRDVVLWTSLITGYAECGHGEEALNCLKQMQLEGLFPDAATYSCCLKSCARLGAIERGQEIHTEIATVSFETVPSVKSTLVDMYVKCGLLVEAWEVHCKPPSGDVISWNTLMAGYTECGLSMEALNCLEQMKLSGVPKDAITFICSLKACSSLGYLVKGQELHGEIVEEGFERDPHVGSTLVDMYAKCGTSIEALEVFNMLPTRDSVSWTALIAVYAEQGLSEKALNCLEQMHVAGLSPDAVTFICTLKACDGRVPIGRGQELHCKIVKQGFDKDPFVSSTLVDMYAKFGSFSEAWGVFGKLATRDVVLWNALIAGYVDHKLNKEVFSCLEHMQLEGIYPNAVTLACILRACGSLGLIDKGHEIYADIVKEGLEEHPLLCNTLVDMYAECGSLVEAQAVLDKTLARDVVSWTALISGYSEHGLGEEAFTCLQEMQLEGVSPDPTTFVCTLKACDIKAMGQEIHTQITKEGFEEDLLVGNSVLDMYVKCGSIVEACDVFEMQLVHDVVSWNTLMAGYAAQGFDEEALNCFYQMQLDGISPDVVSWNTMICIYGEQEDNEKALNLFAQVQEQGLLPNSVTFVSIIKACGSVAALKAGKTLHSRVIWVDGSQAMEVSLATALLDMYCKCGSMVDAQQVFDAMLTRDVVTWNALIAGYARQGACKIVFDLFERMREEAKQPDGVTFLNVLTVCSHVGLVNESRNYVKAMGQEFGIAPSMKHHNCMVDLYSRAGQLGEAVVMLEKIPSQPDFVTWSILLGACQKWGSLELGRHAFDHAVSLDEKHAQSFVLLSNLYSDADMWECTDKIKALRMRF